MSSENWLKKNSPLNFLFTSTLFLLFEKELERQKYIYTKGCVGQFEKWLQDNLIIVAGIFVGIALLQVSLCRLLFLQTFVKLCVYLKLTIWLSSDFVPSLAPSGDSRRHQANPCNTAVCFMFSVFWAHFL